jgi:hypothetical protein
VCAMTLRRRSSAMVAGGVVVADHRGGMCVFWVVKADEDVKIKI